MSLRLPIDWNNPIGYLITAAWQYMGAYIVFRLMACLIPLAFTCFVFAVVTTIGWRYELRTIEQMAKSKQSETDIFQLLTEFVRSHSNIKELSTAPLVFRTHIQTFSVFIVYFLRKQIDCRFCRHI